VYARYTIIIIVDVIIVRYIIIIIRYLSLSYIYIFVFFFFWMIPAGHYVCCDWCTCKPRKTTPIHTDYYLLILSVMNEPWRHCYGADRWNPPLPVCHPPRSRSVRDSTAVRTVLPCFVNPRQKWQQIGILCRRRLYII